jgi:site-specific recombinase XerD
MLLRKYSQGLELEAKPLTLEQMKEREEIEKLDKLFSNVHKNWTNLPEKAKKHHLAKAKQYQGRVPNAKLGNPRLLKITLRTMRHFKATMEYAKTRDIHHVMAVLGHKNIKNTLIYTQLVKLEKEDAFYSATAKTTEEAKNLIDSGFEYVCTTPECIMLFRKRK